MLLGKQANVLRKISEEDVGAELVEWHAGVTGEPIVDNFLFGFHTMEFVGAKIMFFYLKRIGIASVNCRRAFRRPAPFVPHGAMPPAIAAIRPSFGSFFSC
jgi:hypothetical protein